MKVHIEGNTYLESDDYQYVLREYLGTYSTMNKGKDNEYQRENSKVLGYYGTIKQALQAILESKIRSSNASSLCELLREIDELYEYVENITKRETII